MNPPRRIRTYPITTIYVCVMVTLVFGLVLFSVVHGPVTSLCP